MAEIQSDEPVRKRRRFRHAAKIALAILITYGLLAYVIPLPFGPITSTRKASPTCRW
jgi:hypothetical protein